MRTKVTITQSSIYSACSNSYDSGSCPVALALLAAGKNRIYVNGRGDMRWSDNGETYHAYNPKVATFVKRFDSLNDDIARLKSSKKRYRHLLAELQPFSFYLEAA